MRRCGLRDLPSQQFDRSKGKGVILDDRSAKGSGYVTFLEGLVGGGLESGPRPKILVRKKVGSRPVIAVRARLRGHFDLHRASTPVLHVEQVRLHRQLPNRICIWCQIGGSLENVTGDVQAIQGELIPARVAAVSAGIDSFLCSKIVLCVGGSSTSDRPVPGDAGSYRNQIEEVSSRHREILQRLRVDRGLYTGIRYVQ